MKKYVLFGLVFASVFSFCGFVSAQSITLEQAQPIPPDQAKVFGSRALAYPSTEKYIGKDTGEAWSYIPKSAGNAPCFDYYKFQSVDVSLGLDKDTYKPGETLSFRGVLSNKNRYPVVDGYVFVRFVKQNPDFVQEGNYIVDEVLPIGPVAIDASADLPVSFDWVVPATLAAGDYSADFFFSVGKKFNLGGLPFSNEVIVSTTKFKVLSETKTNVLTFERRASKVNGIRYPHIGSWPVVAMGKPVVVEQVLRNDSSVEQKVTLNYSLSYWDGLNSRDNLASKTEVISLAPKSSQKVSYTISTTTETVYYLSFTAKSGSAKSIVNTRIVTEGERPRLNYPAINSFPVMAGATTTLFSCFHNTSDIDTAGSMEVKLFDRFGSIVGDLNYTGPIPSVMSAEKKEILPTRSYSYLRLAATISDKEGRVVDSYESIYDCKILQSADCKILLKAEFWRKTIIVISFAVFIILIILALVFMKKRRLSMLVFFLLCLFGGLFDSGKVEAYYNQKSQQNTVNYVHGFGDPSVTRRFITKGYVQMTHTVGMTKGTTTPNPGETLDYVYDKGNIYFSASDGTWDTPYGRWCWNGSGSWGGYSWTDCGYSGLTTSDLAGSVNAYGDNGNWQPVGRHGFGSDTNGYISWSGIDPTPLVQMVSSDSSVISCSGMTCTAVAPGVATTTAYVPGFSMKIWSYIHKKDCSGCTDSWKWQSERGGTNSYLRWNASCWGIPEALCDGVDDSNNTNPANYTNGFYFPGASASNMSWPVTVTKPTSPCGSDSGLCPITPACDATSVDLSWTAITGSSAYNLRVDDTTANAWGGKTASSTLGTCSGYDGGGDICRNNVTSPYVNYPVIPGHSYHFWVDAMGNGSRSVTFSVPTCPVSTACYAPSEVVSAIQALGASSLSSNTYGYYTFDSNANNSGSVVYPNGTLVNSPQSVTGKFSNAYTLAAKSYIDFGYSTSLLQASGTKTFSIWVKPTGTAAGNILSKYRTDTNEGGYHLQIDSSNRVSFGIKSNNWSTNGVYTTTLSSAIPAGTWTHIAVTVDTVSASKFIKLYVNGELVGSNTSISGTFTDAQAPFLIGAEWYGGGSYAVQTVNTLCTWEDCYFKGGVDDFFVVNKVLTDCEIKKLARGPNGCGAPCALTCYADNEAVPISTLFGLNYPGLVSYWNFDANANDSKGVNSGTKYGAVAFDSGRFGNAAHFPNNSHWYGGSDDRISIPDSASLKINSGTPMTWTAWVKGSFVMGKHRENLGVNSYRFASINDWRQGSPSAGTSLGSKSGFYWDPHSTVAHHEIWAPLDYSSWHHIAVSLDKANNIQKEYIDGVLVSTSTYPGTPSENGLPFEIGINRQCGDGSCDGVADSWTSYIGPGWVDDLALWNVALSDCEIKKLARGPNGCGAPCQTCYDASAVTTPKPLSQIPSVYNASNLVIYYPFDGNVTDVKGGHTPTNGGATFPVSTIASSFGQSAYFNGGVSLQLLNMSGLITNGNYSVCTWYKQESLQAMQELISGREGQYTWSGFEMQTDQNNNPNTIGAGDASSYLTTTKPAFDSWNHICYTKQGTNSALYLNGNVVASLSMAPTNINPFPNSILIGQDGYSYGASGVEYFKGNMDDMAIWSRGLSACEVKSLYVGTDACATPCSVLAASCTVSPTSTSTNSTVIWRATSTGAVGTVKYSWVGSGVPTVNGSSTADHITTSYPNPGTYFATSTISDSTGTSTVACYGNGLGVSILSPQNGVCGSEPSVCSLPGSYPSGQSDDSVNWYWYCSGVNGGADSSKCSALKSLPPEEIDCSVSMVPATSTTPINTSTLWRLGGPAIPGVGYTGYWRIYDNLGTTTVNFDPTASHDLNQIFTTVGLKTVSVDFASSSPRYTYTCNNPSYATTSVVLPGSLNEI